MKLAQHLLLSPLVENWFSQNQRSLPWRENRTPYRVWLAEIMLQQTQVQTVLPYYLRFLEHYPTLAELALADEDAVMKLWSGLGYYSRLRRLHQCAKIIVERHHGEFPTTREALLGLPGIGSYTAGALLAFAFNRPAPMVDGNVARVLARLHNDPTPIDTPQGKKHFEALSSTYAHAASNVQLWQEGLMELGATVCTAKAPDCLHCPIQMHCQAHLHHDPLALPIKSKKVEKTAQDVVLALVYHGEFLWLERNDRNLLFGKLYAPPYALTPHTPDALKQLLSERHLQLLKQKHAFSLQRVLTHRILNIFVYECEVSHANHPNFVQASTIFDRPMAAAVRRSIEQSWWYQAQPNT